MVTLHNLRELYGEVVETASIARSLLAPVASQLSGDPSNLHRRCVLGHTLFLFSRPDGVRDDLAPFGAIEAVAVCDLALKAVIVFWDEASAGVALGRQQEATFGWYTAVPPLDAALPQSFFPPNLIQVALYPQTPAATAALAPRRRLRPFYSFQNSPHEEAIPSPRHPAGTTQFFPSENSLVYGPVIGADGHLWMDGENYLYDEDGVRKGPAWIRVALLNSPGIYCSDPQTFVPLFSVY